MTLYCYHLHVQLSLEPTGRTSKDRVQSGAMRTREALLPSRVLRGTNVSWATSFTWEVLELAAELDISFALLEQPEDLAMDPTLAKGQPPCGSGSS